MLKKTLYVSLLIFGIGLLNVSAQTVKTISKGVVNGSAISLPKPVYPAAARAVRASGAVNVQVTVDEDGNVVSAAAVSGHPLLRASAVEAARMAKFKPTLLSGQTVKISGVIVYNFAPPPMDEANTKEKPDAPIMGFKAASDDSSSVINGLAVNLAKPPYPAAARAVRASGTVNVQVLIDEEGNVVSAEAISGHPLLRAASVNAALQSKFKKTTLAGKPVKVNGIIVYKFLPPESENDSAESPTDAISGGVLNGKALSLPKPAYPSEAKERNVGGAVNVEVIIDESGNVISAKAVTGHPLLHEASEQAAMQAKFSPTFLEGNPVKVRGVVVYNFVP